MNVTEAVLFLLLVAFLRTDLFGVQRADPITEDGKPLSYHIEQLKSLDPEIYERAQNQISRLKEKAGPAVPALVAVLKNSDPKIHNRVILVITLSNIVPADEAVTALIDLLKNDADPIIRLWAAQGLANAKPQKEKIIPALIEAMRDKYPAVGTDARRSLRKLDEKAFKDAMKGAIFDQRWWVRSIAVEGLAELGPVDRDFVLPLLREAVRDSNEFVRDDARKALDRILTVSPK